MITIEDIKTIANNAIPVMDDICIEAARLRTFCHEVIDAVESVEEDFKETTLDGEKAKVIYLAFKARIIAFAESIPTSVPAEPEE